METHPSRGRAIAGAATQAGQGISPSDYARSLYIAPGMPTIIQPGKISVNRQTFPKKPQLFQLGKNDTMGKSHPLLNWERNAISRFNKCALFLAQHICLLFTFVFLSHLSSHHVCLLITFVFSSRLSSYHVCLLITFVFLSHLSSHHVCLLITFVFSSRLSSHHVCLLITFVFSSRLRLTFYQFKWKTIEDWKPSVILHPWTRSAERYQMYFNTYIHSN